MNKELYVSSTPHETRVALMEDDQLAEVFFERENEYTLAGSIYKGRVTRVLPGMQSAFVDIGLERDAFLYVSDFLELGDEEDSEEFGEIPAPPSTIHLNSQSQPSAEPPIGRSEPAANDQAGFVAAVEDFAAQDTESENETGESHSPAGDDQKLGAGARRWRGRRRRGGRRGGREDRPHQTEHAAQPGETQEPAVSSAEPEGGRHHEALPQPPTESHFDSRAESRRRPEYAPPAGYTPIVLPGESISKYRNLPQPTVSAAESDEPKTASETNGAIVAGPVEDFIPPVETPPTHEMVFAEPEEVVDTFAAQPESTEAAVAPHEEAGTSVIVTSSPEVQAMEVENYHEQEEVEPGAAIETPYDPLHEEASGHGAIETHSETQEEELTHDELPPPNFAGGFQQHSAPAEAPEGRTLEHETLEDDEMEFHPMPENIEAMSEVASDSELELVEETLDSRQWLLGALDSSSRGCGRRRSGCRRGARRDSFHRPHRRRGRRGRATRSDEEESNGRAEVARCSSDRRLSATPDRAPAVRSSQRPGTPGRRTPQQRARWPAPPAAADLRPVEGRPGNPGPDRQGADRQEGRAHHQSHRAAGTFLVYMPTVNHVGVSRKINSEEERQRLKRIVTSERENGLGGFIVRTAAANIKEDELRADIRFLKHLWAEIKNRADNGKSPALIYHDLNLVERILRDQVNADFSQIWVDTEDEYERVVRFASRFQPSLVRRIKLYTKDTPLYEQFGIQDEINKALKSKVWLKSGGYIVINQTEALVAIDVNTGKYVGKTQRLEDTIVKTNVDAIKEIVRQIRLRDLGGIIVIDFIDMDERRNRQKVMQALEEALRADRAPSKVLQFNDFGLVAITRKRVKQSLERTLGEPCPYCAGAGFVKSVTTVCNEIYIEMRKMIKEHDRTDITLRVNPEVAKALKASNGKLITEMEDLTGKTVLVKSDAMLHQENFDIQ